ncbi:MAG: MinD/ParA family protein [Deltaproteobacteria bacterium]|nr:MAG: MinD/ParA family protein [Deltaproteobacteria bacterium]
MEQGEMTGTVERKLRVVSISSGKGGVGKTVLTLNLAHIYQSLGHRVLVIDGNLGNGNVDSLFRSLSEYSLVDVARGVVPIGKVLKRTPSGIFFLPAGSALGTTTSLTTEEKLTLFSELDSLEDVADLVLVDCPSGIHDVTLFFVRSSTDLVCVTTPEITSVISTLSFLTLLSSRGEKEAGIIVNMTEDDGDGTNTFEVISEQVGKEGGMKVHYIGHFPYDYTVIESIRFLQPLVEKEGKGHLRGYLLNIAQEILRNPPEEKIKKCQQFFTRRLLREEHDTIFKANEVGQ